MFEAGEVFEDIRESYTVRQSVKMDSPLAFGEILVWKVWS